MTSPRTWELIIIIPQIRKNYVAWRIPAPRQWEFSAVTELNLLTIQKLLLFVFCIFLPSSISLLTHFFTCNLWNLLTPCSYTSLNVTYLFNSVSRCSTAVYNYFPLVHITYKIKKSQHFQKKLITIIKSTIIYSKLIVYVTRSGSLVNITFFSFMVKYFAYYPSTMNETKSSKLTSKPTARKNKVCFARIVSENNIVLLTYTF